VTGDARVAATLAEGGQTGSSGIGRAVESTFGNLQLVLATLLVLAGLTTVGGTTAAFAQAVHARRRTIGIYRVTGATAGDIVRTILSDALVIGIAASAIATVLGFLATFLIERAGYLTIFGVRLSTTPSLQIIFGSVVGGLVVTLAGAGLATLTLLRVDPATLLQPEESSPASHPGDRQ
jgi:ABC-type antimicrobial peptide transport system permease subunit